MARMPGVTWRGPTVNSGDGDGTPMEPADALIEYRGIVVHIAAGYYEGTISWQHNPSADVSSHFVVASDGRIAQVVDTHDRAWTQREGNSRWLSIENEGFLPDPLTPEQVEANAKILAWVHEVHGIPLQLATSPDGRGLGHHSMGAENGVTWGHSQCPGEAIKAQKPTILARAIEIVRGDMTPQELLSVKLSNGYSLNNALVTLLARTPTDVVGRLDAILAAAQDDADVTVQLAPEALAELAAVRADIAALPTAEQVGAASVDALKAELND